jgi:hypothetical protein
MQSFPPGRPILPLPERNFPGVVFQGDSLHALLDQLREIRNLAGNGDLSELIAELDDVVERMEEVEQWPRKVCGEQGIKLPYP